VTGRRRSGKRTPTHHPVQATGRRAAQRLPVQLMVRLSATDRAQQIGEGTTLDLSKNGCKLCSAHVLPIGSFGDLYLTIHETSPPILISAVRAVRVAEHEYGIDFLRVTAQERIRLRHFLWKQMTRSAIKSGPPLFALVGHSSPQQPNLKSLP
jgi:hypothetical protein